jgi:hypothetical protein
MRASGLLQLARELEETARVVSAILRAVQEHAGPRPVRRIASAARPVKPGEVRRVRAEYIPPKKKRGK